MTSIRINKFLAERLGLSRRESDEYIEQGRVVIDGNPARLGQAVTESSTIAVDGKTIDHKVAYRYIALNKPANYVCSRKRQGDSPTIYELIPDDMHELKPVGRLDRDSSGLILLTNDGDFAHRMTHPSFYKTKIYQVALDKPLQPLHRQMISDFGVMLEDGKSQFGITKGRVHPSASLRNEFETSAPPPEARLAPQTETEQSPTDDLYTITMSEGRNRQIRRTFAALGYTVTQLHRIVFGNYSLGDIPAGQWHELVIS